MISRNQMRRGLLHMTDLKTIGAASTKQLILNFIMFTDKLCIRTLLVYLTTYILIIRQKNKFKS